MTVNMKEEREEASSALIPPTQLEKSIFNSVSEDFRGLPNTVLFPTF